MIKRKIILALLAGVTLVANLAYAETAMVSMAAKNGVVRCLPTLKSTADYLDVSNVDYTVFDSYYTKDTNNRLYTDTIIKKYSDGSTSLAVLTASPYAESCDYTLQQVFTSNASCLDMRESTLKDWKYSQSIKDIVVLKSSSGNSSYYLKPVGSGCVAVKIE